MWKKEHKQKKGIYYSVAVIALGCLITSMYAGHGPGAEEEYSVDLSALDHTAGKKITDAQQDGEGQSAAAGDASEEVADANTTSVINPKPAGQEIAIEQQSRGQASLTAEDLISDEIVSILPTLAQQAPELAFSEQDGIGWPVTGDVILGYSMDKSVFFETLQQYRYNPAVYISADVGATVNACARGQVTEIGQDPQIGTYVKTSLGNGYEVTYGQLADLQVKKDDVVARGQVIGNVAENTIYFAKEGPHVYLEIEKDGMPINPMDLFQ